MYNDISYQTFQNSERYGYMYQYPRNTLQLNRGMSNDTTGIPTFSEIAYLSGIANTDWSWAPLLIDADNDPSWSLDGHYSYSLQRGKERWNFYSLYVCNNFRRDIRWLHLLLG